MLEGSNPFLLDRGAEAIWATIVLRQAYDVADWMAEKGYTSYETRGHYCCGEEDNMRVPYDPKLGCTPPAGTGSADYPPQTFPGENTK